MFGNLPIIFDSASTAAGDRFRVTREEYGLKALKVDLELPRGTPETPFRLRMGARSYGDVKVAVIQSTPYRVVRTRPLIQDGDGRIGFVFPLAGRFAGEQWNRSLSLVRGQATVLASDRTGWFGTASGGAFLTIRVPPGLLQARATSLEDHTGRAVSPSRAGIDLLRGYLSMLNRLGAGATPHFAELAGRHLAEIALHAIANSESSASLSPGEGLRAGRLAMARAHLAAHFTDPGYDVAACAGHVGVSVRSLQALFESQGTSFGEELRRLRLRHARHLLLDPANFELRVSDVAFDSGFSDISHFTRQFRACFGESPTSLRSARKNPPEP